MELFAIVSVALVGAMLALSVSHVLPQYSIYIVFATGLLLVFLSLDGLFYLLDFVSEVNAYLQDNAAYVKLLLKMVGIAYVSEFTCDLCKDCGYQTLATQVQTAGKLAILVSALPMLKSLMEVIGEVVRVDV